METVTAQVGAGMLKGSAKASFDSDDNQWWHMGLENALAKRKKTKKKKKQQQNEGSDEDAAASSAGAPPLIMDELFRATGGARLGMRARCSQPGKLLRAETSTSANADASEAPADGAVPQSEEAASKKKRKAEPTDTAVASLEPVGKTRKKDKAKKDKATKKKEDDEPAKAGPATAAAAAAALSDAQSAAQKKARKKARRLAREQRDAAQPSGSRLSSS